ncbi:SH3 domain-containing protein [Leptospira sp. 96542]|nr:SH3 domain-containing protein [Leptospira sp. 96542]
MNRLFVLIILLLFSFQCNQKPSVEIGKPAFISATILNSRIAPSSSAEKNGQVKLGDEVMVLERSKDKEEIDSVAEYWFKVKTPTLTGWVFGAYLSVEPVASKEAILKMSQGHFVYCSFPDQNDCSHTIGIEGSKFILRKFDRYSGITDRIDGIIEVYPDYVLFTPKTRLIRPSVYIQFPNTEEERTAYNNAYYPYSDSDAHLVGLDTYTAEGPIKLYYITCNNLLLYSDVKQTECNLKYAYIKSSSRF